ncbi:MAG: MFS transporter [Ignavibacteriales bacterium]|nr:MFS transporter [Ignavibacteriales bacterium]MCB9260007.1 MFS transporter [Ignavibacteriales bacterium]
MIKNISVKKNSLKYWQIKIFSATWLAYVGYYFARKAFYVVKSPLADSLNFTALDLAHLGTAYLIFYMVGQYSSAYFGRKLGPKLLLLIGMGISLTCNFVFGISNSFWTILLFLSLNGLAQGTGWPGCIGSLAFWFSRKKRGTILGFWATCYQVGSVISTSFAAYMLGEFGWRWSFFGASIVLLIIWFIVLFMHPNRPEDVGLESIKDNDDSCEQDDDPSGKLGWSKDVWSTVITMGLIYFTIKFLRYALWSWVPFFLNKNFAMEASNAGYLSVVFDLAGFAGVLFAGVASDKIFKGRRSLISAIMLTLMAFAFILMYLKGESDLLFFTISLGIAGFMLYGPDSLISGVGAIDVGSKRGALTAAGIINGTGSIGPIFQEEIIGWLYTKYNQELTPILILLLSMALISALLTYYLWWKSRKGKVSL